MREQQDSLVRALGVVFLGIVVLSLFYNIFFGAGMMYGTGGMNDMSGMHAGMGAVGGFGLGSLLGAILMLLMKIFSAILVVSLLLGIWVVIRDYVLVNNGDNFFGELFAPFQQSKITCPQCRSSVNSRFKFCPDCGQALTPEKV